MSKKQSFIRVSKITMALSLVIISTIARAEPANPAGLSELVKEVLVNPQPGDAQKSDEDLTQKVEIQKIRAAAIDQYYAERNMPLKGYGAIMVETADKYGLDWRLIPAISIRESTGGKFACKNATFNPFGWGSCKKKFSFRSYEHAIDTIGKNLAGKNPVTAMHYDNKTIREVLQSYNPPSVIPKYADEVMSFMDKIGMYVAPEYR
jgi:hypothetical protein